MKSVKKPAYVCTYIDRTGKKRCYFRAKGYNIPLPDLSSEEFEYAYRKAMAEVTANAQDRSPKNIVKKRQNQTARGYIYFLRYNGNVKIGFSERPIARLAGLRTALSDPIECFLFIQGTRKMERELHKRFDNCRRDGEWFKANNEILTVMAWVAKYTTLPEMGANGVHILANGLTENG